MPCFNMFHIFGAYNQSSNPRARGSRRGRSKAHCHKGPEGSYGKLAWLMGMKQSLLVPNKAYWWPIGILLRPFLPFFKVLLLIYCNNGILLPLLGYMVRCCFDGPVTGMVPVPSTP